MFYLFNSNLTTKTQVQASGRFPFCRGSQDSTPGCGEAPQDGASCNSSVL